jgi:hypothetical protein
MQTIKQKMDEILGKEVETQKKKQFQLIKDVLFLFEQYLNNYGHEFLSISETKRDIKKRELIFVNNLHLRKLLKKS